ncbi:hypothetical protein VNO80_16041 [Phaseolus coccineus]|uniref:Protein kinase domain-containing protein n=1 Tax=Phaseolus coccineus TaxID=3886 RepID=A0AAN9QZR3_PHACN
MRASPRRETCGHCQGERHAVVARDRHWSFLGASEVVFSDVFGPSPVEASITVSSEKHGDYVATRGSGGKIYNDFDLNNICSQSLLAPTTCIGQSLQLSKLTLHETEDALDLEEGKVYQVRRAGSSEMYAMKVMRKDKIIERNHVEYVKSERDILTKTKYRLYLVLDFVNCGHLFFQLYHQGLFREDLARFYVAKIIYVVSYIHANEIMHKDLKPENILLDVDGHAVLTDFGLANQFNETGRSNSMCGTVEYMAPEIVMAKGNDKAVDWWSLGILLCMKCLHRILVFFVSEARNIS